MGNKQLALMLRGVVMVAIFIAIWVWIIRLVRRFDAAIAAAPATWLQPAGWILALAGGALGLTCVWLFFTAGRGTPAPFDPPKLFVAIGPYRYVRNPMYIAGLMVLAGTGLIVRSYSIIILAVLFGCLAHIMVLLHEEPDLRRRFGDSFVQYTREVNRWLPRSPRNQR